MARRYKYKQGDVVGGWYLHGHLGVGGNGEVWKARRDGQSGALKIVDAAPGTERWARFEQEIAIQRRFAGHRVLLPMLDAKVSTSAGEPGWLAMPEAEGIRVTLGEQPPLREVVRAAATLADGLAELAADGMAHRDLKPENLFRCEERWVVGDLGLADVPDKPELTNTGTLGPIFYLAPEMMDAKSVADARPADVFSLAKTLFALAAGLPFPVPGMLSRTHRVTRLSGWVSDERGPLLDLLLERATDVAPERRPTMSEFAYELTAWLAGVADPVGGPVGAGDLAARLDALNAPGRDEEEQFAENQRLLREATALANQELVRIDTAAREMLGDCGPGGHPDTASAGVPTEFRARAVEVDMAHRSYSSRGLRKVYLSFVITFHLDANGDLYIAAAQTIDKWAPDSGQTPLVRLWQAGRAVPIGSLGQGAFIREAANGLMENLLPAVQRFEAEVAALRRAYSGSH